MTGDPRTAGHGYVPTVHGSYRALLDDPDVDVVYVATPHPHHSALALTARAAAKADPGGEVVYGYPAATRVPLRLIRRHAPRATGRR